MILNHSLFGLGKPSLGGNTARVVLLGSGSSKEKICMMGLYIFPIPSNTVLTDRNGNKSRNFVKAYSMKGIVPREFSLQVLFPLIIFPRAPDYDIRAIFFPKFAKIVAASDATLVSTTPVAN